VTYGAVKFAGYSYFASWLNMTWSRSVPLLKFGFGKTLIGVVAGTSYFFALMFSGHLDDGELWIFLGAMPVRMLAWFVAIWMFYGLKRAPWATLQAILAGTALSYGLDGVMWVIYRYFPGMMMPWC
jgi:hypothetical protein